MSVWRMEDAVHTAMRAHAPFHHSDTVDGTPHIVPKFHGLAVGQKQHDGSYIFHCSLNFAERLRHAGFEPELIHEHVLKFHPAHNALAARLGIWSVWTALGAHAYDPEAEPHSTVIELDLQHQRGEIDDATCLARLRELAL